MKSTLKIGLISGILLFSPALSRADEITKPDPAAINFVLEKYSETVPAEEVVGWKILKIFIAPKTGKATSIANIDYCADQPIACFLTETEGLRNTKSVRQIISVDSDKVNSFLTDLSRKFNRDPIDAKLDIADNRVTLFEASQAGLTLDSEKALRVIEQAILRGEIKPGATIKLPYISPEPKIKSADINNLGIEGLIGEGRSNFKGSPKNRIHNIKTAVARFEGWLIKPGEEFSFVSLLGEVDGEHGYKEELVIKHDKTEPEFGGGICQVSTTMFRAAINSGLKITARRNHAYPVSYYSPQGMDATVYIPRPDLRFINNTPGHILIKSSIVGTELTFQMFGTSDGRKVEISGPVVTQRNPDGSMKTSFSQKVLDRSGAVLIDDVFKSAYDSPNKYPHPGQEPVLTSKPKDWSEREWKEYKRAHNF